MEGHVRLPDDSFSIRSTIRRASATASAIAATYAGEFLGTVASFLAARIDAHTAITADFRDSSTSKTIAYSIRLVFATDRKTLAHHRQGGILRYTSIKNALRNNHP